MSYADIASLRSRAGILADAWDATTVPKDPDDLQRYLDDAAAEIDAAVGGMGFSVPVTDPVAAAALAGWNADKALLVALSATWPGGEGPQAVSDTIKAVTARITAYEKALDAGGLAAIQYLRALEANAASGTANFWSTETDYSPWLDDLYSGPVIDYGGGIIIRGPVGPEYHKMWTRF